MSKKASKPIYTLPAAEATAIDSAAEIPQSLDIERSVLGILLCENSSNSQMAILHLMPEAFYDPANSMIFAAIKQLSDEGKLPDLHTVGVLLKQQNRLSAVGGMSYLVELVQYSASGVMIGQHVQILLQTHISRQVLQASYNAVREVLSGDVDIADTISTLSMRVEQAMLGAVIGSSSRHISEIVKDSISAAKQREERFRNGQSIGISSGLSELDRLTYGWQPGQLIVLAARPGMGKTAVMIHLMMRAAHSGVPVCVYSLEMPSISLCDRAVVAESEGRVNADNLRRGKLSDAEWSEIDEAQKRIDRLPVYIDDRSNVSMQYVATHSRMMNKQGKCDLICIDYLQLMDTRTAERGRNREQEVAQCSKAAKVLAKELGVPVILLAQLNRAVEGRGGKEPMLSDLRESGAIEQDADIVMFIHRPEYYDTERVVEVSLSNGTKRDIDSKGFGILAVAKNRNGSTGKAKFSYNESLTVFTDFDQTPYLHSANRSTYVARGDRQYGENSIHHVAPPAPSSSTEALAPSESVPF